MRKSHGQADTEITDAMISAAIRAMEPYFWDDGVGACLGPSVRPAVEAALRAALQEVPRPAKPASKGTR